MHMMKPYNSELPPVEAAHKDAPAQNDPKLEEIRNTLSKLNRVRREELFEAVTEEIDDVNITEMYRDIILGNIALEKVPTEQFDAFVEDLSASEAAQELLKKWSGPHTKAATPTQHAMHPRGRLVPGKPGLSDYDAVRGSGKTHEPNFGIWKSDDEDLT